MAANDKRDIVRLKKRITVRFGIEEPNRVAFTEDISGTGMFIKTPNICPPNTKIRIEFEVANNKVELEARVMWAKKVPQNLFHLVKKSGMGVRFLRFYSGEEHFNSYVINAPT
jgi:c-di-GMP-binding flagellar brake protein YcgR